MLMLSFSDLVQPTKFNKDLQPAASRHITTLSDLWSPALLSQHRANHYDTKIMQRTFKAAWTTARTTF